MLFFANEFFLWFLIPTLLIPVVYALVCAGRTRRVRKFGDRELVEELMPSRSPIKGWIRTVLLMLALQSLIIGLSRPQIGAKLTEHEINGAEIIVCLDVSNSMLAKDYSPNRLERAKLAISRMSDKLQKDRLGLVIFAGSPFVQLPVTSDYISAKMFLNSISTDAIPVQGTAIGDAIELAMGCFSSQNEKSRAIVVISDGENHEDDPVKSAAKAAEAGIKVYTIGVGSAEGEPIPVNGGLLKDSEGNTVVTHLDEKTLKEIADAGNGAYVHAGNVEFGLGPIIDDLRKLEDEQYKSVSFEEFDEQYMYFIAAALILFVLEMLIGDRRHKKRLF